MGTSPHPTLPKGLNPAPKRGLFERGGGGGVGLKKDFRDFGGSGCLNPFFGKKGIGF